MRTVEEIFYDLINTLTAEIRRLHSNVDTSGFQTKIDSLVAEFVEQGKKLDR